MYKNLTTEERAAIYTEIEKDREELWRRYRMGKINFDQYADGIHWLDEKAARVRNSGIKRGEKQ